MNLRFKQLIFVLLFATIVSSVQAKVIDTVFGPVDETNPAVLELIESKAMQRLKAIDQSGPEAYFTNNFPKFSRYDHSLGVYALLKRYNVSIEEQISGLLHDASHTVFSHLGDLVFQTGAQRSESYQDNVHDFVLKNMGVDRVLAEYKLSLPEVSPKNPQFLALEQPYPDMNADRIEYNLHTGLVFNDLTAQDVEQILAHLKFENNKWYFTDVINAKKFARLSTYYNKAFWGSAHNHALYAVGTTALKYALHNHIISADDLHYSVDQDVIQKLQRSKSPELKQLLSIMHNIDNYYVIANKDNYDIGLPIKMRGIDPLVMQNGSLKRLSEVNIHFKSELELTREYCKSGSYLTLTNIPDKKILNMIIAANSN